MSTDIDWQHELDSSFGTGHDEPVGRYVAAGRTAVRRRRASVLAIAVAVVFGVGAAWATSPGATPRGDAPVATRPAAPDTDEQQDLSAQDALETVRKRARQAARDQAAQMGSPATLTYDGLVLAPGAGPVLKTVANPMDYTEDQGRSVGIRVMMDGKEQYALLTAYPADSTSATVVFASGDFAGWLAQAVRTQRTLDVANGVTPSAGDTSDMPWLVLDAQGAVEVRAGVVLVEQRTSVDLGDNFSDGSTSAGVVRLVIDGRTEYAAYRVIDGSLDVIPGGGSFDSMGAFITWARNQYSSGAGLR